MQAIRHGSRFARMASMSLKTEAAEGVAGKRNGLPAAAAGNDGGNRQTGRIPCRSNRTGEKTPAVRNAVNPMGAGQIFWSHGAPLIKAGASSLLAITYRIENNRLADRRDRRFVTP